MNKNSVTNFFTYCLTRSKKCKCSHVSPAATRKSLSSKTQSHNSTKFEQNQWSGFWGVPSTICPNSVECINSTKSHKFCQFKIGGKYDQLHKVTNNPTKFERNMLTKYSYSERVTKGTKVIVELWYKHSMRRCWRDDATDERKVDNMNIFN